MRLNSLFALASVAMLATVVGCSAKAGSDSSTSDSAYTGDGDPAAPQAGACAAPYWTWVLNDLEPKFDQPITAVTEDQLMALVATHPDMGETPTTYSICWSFIFDKHFVGDALHNLHQADVTFGDQSSPDYKSYARYQANVAMTPELRRNAKAILALKPRTMSPTDEDTWAALYDTVVSEVIHPVGIPGPLEYEDVVEREWFIDTAESEYLDIVEQSRSEPEKDGVYGEWMDDASKWIFGPPPASSRSFVFNVPWEPGADRGGDYGLSGLQVVAGDPVMPAIVQSFVTRLKTSMPRAIGSQDSSSWMNVYHARGLRALGDLSQGQPLVTKTDSMALDVLEGIKPRQLQGLFTYQTWLELTVIAAGETDTSWLTRFLPIEPCVAASDLDAAKQSYTDKTGTLTNNSIPAPHTCAAP